MGIIPRGWGLPPFLCKPSFSSLGLTAFSPPTSHPHPSDPFLSQEDAQPPRVLEHPHLLLAPILRISMFAAGKSSLSREVWGPQPLLYCPVAYHL